jgi:hypothetical protein
MIWLSATKGGKMKDCKYTKINKWVTIREYSTGDYGITFLGGGSHGWYYEFSKENKLKFKQQRSAYGVGKASKNESKNWEDFKRHIKKILETDDLPPNILKLYRWRFYQPIEYQYIEKKLGCVVYFKRIEK